LDLRSSVDKVTDRQAWASRGAAFMAKVKATKTVWFPPKPAAAGRDAGKAAAKATGTTAKKTTKKTARATKKTTKATGAAKKAASAAGSKS
jgi:hypothetical protein